jgi:hypothetical protein
LMGDGSGGRRGEKEKRRMGEWETKVIIIK